MTRLVWLRHGRTPWNQEGRFQGQTDIALDEVGHAQAERAASYLIHLEPSLIITKVYKFGFLNNSSIEFDIEGSSL